MKKRLLFIPLLVLVLVVSMGMPVLAWDEEDLLVASSEDFIWGVGWDGDSSESYYGEQSWSYYPTPNDGYNLYRDDVTDTGNLNVNDLITRTPEAIVGLSIEWAFPELDGGFWYMGDESPDTYYWATEPRGYDNPEPEPEPVEPKREKDPNRFTVLMPFGRDGTRYVSEDDNTLRSSIEVTGIYGDTGYKLVIPEGCEIERPSGKRLHCLYLKDIDGGTLTFTSSDTSFSEPCILYTTEGELTHNMWGRMVTDGEWTEVGTFTSIVDREAHLD